MEELEQRIIDMLRKVMEICGSTQWKGWVQSWLDGKDRTKDSADAAADSAMLLFNISPKLSMAATGTAHAAMMYADILRLSKDVEQLLKDAETALDVAEHYADLAKDTK